MLTEWPNRLGFDIGTTEVWKHKDAFRVFTTDKVLRVPYTITTNPETAAALCDEQGLLQSSLEEMHFRDAQRLYFETLPQQKELF